MSVSIVNNRIKGTRITVWDVVHYLEGNWTAQEIADVLRLSLDQVKVTVKYIEEHRDEVMSVHRQIEARNARGNPPEVEKKVVETRAKMQAWLMARQLEKELEKSGRFCAICSGGDS